MKEREKSQIIRHFLTLRTQKATKNLQRRAATWLYGKIKKEDKEMSHKTTVFRGDGIGPELVDNVLKILKAADAPLEYEIFNVGEDEWKRNGALILSLIHI